MLVVKKINNNVAMAEDAEGHEVVVFGRGIGFRSMPYELEDETQIQRIFHHVDEGLLQTIKSISPEIVGAALDIVRVAEEKLHCKLNPNLYLELADHLQFAAERFADGIILENPLAPEIPSVYPAEYELGWIGLRIVADVTGITLPEAEVYAIALYIANAETSGGPLSNTMDEVMKVVHIIDEVTTLIEEQLGVEFDRKSYDYLRFTSHLRYLIKRLSTGTPEATTRNDAMFKQMSREYPEGYLASNKVATYFNTTHGWELTDSERFYLLVYVVRLESTVKKN